MLERVVRLEGDARKSVLQFGCSLAQVEVTIYDLRRKMRALTFPRANRKD